MGDINGDLWVNSADIERFTQVLLAPGAATAAELCAADANGDTMVDLLDVDALTQLLLNQ